jgi:hypothetical protein
MNRYARLAVFVCLLCSACKKDTKQTTVYYNNGPTDSLKINQYRIVASHNSYHHKTDSVVFNLLLSINASGSLPAEYNPNYIDYDHENLTDQLETYGLRGIEIDVWNDPAGGNYYYRQGYALAGYSPDSHIDALKQPGFKVLHIPDFDFNPTNYTFKDVLAELKKWSEAHPNHLPLYVNVETEVSAPGDELTALPGLTKAIPFDALAADNLDLEVKSVFGATLEGIITPDKVRGSYATLEQAVLAGNWPKLADARGKIIFIIDPDGNSGTVYKTGHASLQGRAMFVYSNPGTAEAAFVKLNDPTGSFAEIQQRVAQGYIVRTMCDEATKQARSGDYSRMNTALAGWAQILSTDYYRPDPRAGTPGWTNYTVKLPINNIAQIDSISAASKLNLGTIKE